MREGTSPWITDGALGNASDTLIPSAGDLRMYGRVMNAAPASSTPADAVRILPCVNAPDHAQLQRFEMKYLVSEPIARAMRQYIRCRLVPDEFAAHSADYSYAVHTLYLDSPDLCLYGATENGDKNRFKLRIRFYDNGADAPAFFEVKRRRNECISKLRAKVRRDAVEPLLAGEWPQLHHLVKPDAKQLFALHEFCRLMRHLRATPRSHVGYRREAWMSPGNNSLRLTFDRQVQCEPQFGSRLNAGVNTTNAVEPFETQVIFELKFTNRMPNWCAEMVRVFGLVRGGAAKYAAGVALMGEHRVSSRGVGITTSPERRRIDSLVLHGDTVNVH